MQATSYHKFQLISSSMTRQKRYRIDLVMSNMLIIIKSCAQEQSSWITDSLYASHLT